MQRTSSKFLRLGLLLAGIVGYVLVGLAWLRWGGEGPEYWRDDTAVVVAEMSSASGTRTAQMTVRTRIAAGDLGWSDRKEEIVVVKVSDKSLSETWAITRLDTGTGPMLPLGLVWSGDEQVTVLSKGRPQVSFTLARVVAE